MNCAERKDLILLHAFDQLEPAEAAPLLTHLRDGCPRCAGELAAARTISGLVAVTAPPVAPSPAVKERVLRAVAGEAPSTPRFPMRWTAAIAVGVLAASVTAVVILIPARRGVEKLRGELASAHDAIRALENRATTAEATLRSLGSTATTVTALENAGPQAGASGRLFSDASNRTWHVFMTHMKPSASGRTYELWFITADQKKVPAGTFDVGSDGGAFLDVAVPKDLGTVALAAVTEEPAGGVPQPTGAIQLVGKLGS